MLDTLARGGERRAPVEPVHRTVEGLMRLAKFRGHQVRVVELGERRACVSCAGVQQRLSRLFPSWLGVKPLGACPGSFFNGLICGSGDV